MTTKKTESHSSSDSAKKKSASVRLAKNVTRPREIGGPKGLEPTRYGDWEQKGRCSDF